MKKNNESKPKSLFWKIYRIVVFILALLIINVWVIFYSFLDTYENNVPETVISNVVEKLNKQKYKELPKKMKSEEFYSGEDLAKLLLDNTKHGSFTYKRINTLDDKDTISYKILSEDKEALIITIAKTKKKTSFNIDKWKVKDIEFKLLNRNKIKVIVPTSSKLSINAIDVDEKYISAKDSVREKFDTIKSIVDVPKENIYELDGIIEGTKVAAKYKDKDYELVEDNKEYYFTYPYDENMFNSAKERLDSFVDNYTRYIIAENGFGTVSPYLVRNTSAYSFLSKIAMTNIWSGDHTRAELSELKYSNTQTYSDGLFSTDVNYTYSYYVGDNKKDFDTHLTLYLVKTDNVWYVVDLTM